MKLKNIALVLSLISPAAFASENYFLSCVSKPSALIKMYFYPGESESESEMDVNVIITKNDQIISRRSGLVRNYGTTLGFNVDGDLDFVVTFSGEIVTSPKDKSQYFVGASIIDNVNYICFKDK